MYQYYFLIQISPIFSTAYYLCKMNSPDANITSPSTPKIATNIFYYIKHQRTQKFFYSPQINWITTYGLIKIYSEETCIWSLSITKQFIKEKKKNKKKKIWANSFFCDDATWGYVTWYWLKVVYSRLKMVVIKTQLTIFAFFFSFKESCSNWIIT